MTPLQNRLGELRDFYEKKLLQDCLPFWIDHAVDHEFGGFITSLNQDGSIIDTDKSVWQQGRFTWLLAELYNDQAYHHLSQRNGWLQLAKHGARFLERFCFDPADGRMWFHVDQTGNPLRKRRYAFSESFAAIAFGEMAKATGEDRYRELAAACFKSFLSHARNPELGPPKYTNVRPTRSLGIPMITIGTAQELRNSIELSTANHLIDQSIEEIRKYFIDSDLKCVLETVGQEGEVIDHFDGRTLNPGHAIEAAWFIMTEGRLRKSDELISLGQCMLDWMFERGWDRKHGGLLYFVDVHGLPVQEYWHDMKFWWPHNETMIATLLAFELTRKSSYLDMHEQVRQWSFDHFDDPEHGEWFGYLHRDGSLSVPLKGNHWKGPFHYPRMLLQCLRAIARMESEPDN